MGQFYFKFDHDKKLVLKYLDDKKIKKVLKRLP